ncbi:hypothetical protein Acr_17g0012700 [Actinidia rufa]|uniref:Uncharacterized protein n=1 Tax=Actinidia rufa TaxID=165716 RepID=A0A7J0G4K5_9ERIC|nr:hypothetical protein Acr_17g0012700 [Actinidia rufa]
MAKRLREDEEIGGGNQGGNVIMQKAYNSNRNNNANNQTRIALFAGWTVVSDRGVEVRYKTLVSKDYVICRLQKSRGGKHGNEAPVNTPSGCFNNKRIKLSSKQNQQTEPAPLIDEQVGLINGEAGVETLEQIMQYLLEPDSSMVNVENLVATNTLATLPPSASYDLSERTSMPPLVEDKPAATVDEEGGCTSRKQESIAAPKSLADDAVMDSIILLSTTVEGFAEDFIEDFVGQFLNGN